MTRPKYKTGDNCYYICDSGQRWPVVVVSSYWDRYMRSFRYETNPTPGHNVFESDLTTEEEYETLGNIFSNAI